MTTALFSNPIYRAFTAGGVPLAGGLLYTYSANSTTPQTTWSDAAGTQPNTNPVVLDSTGSAVVRLDPTLTYKFVLTDSGGGPQSSADYYQSLYLTAASIGALLYPPVAAEGSTVTAGGFPYGYPQRYGAAGDGVTDDTVAVQAAFNSGYEVTLTGGLVFLISKVTLNNSVVIRGYGTLKQKAATVGSMIYGAPGTSYGFKADGVIFDGNQANQAASSPNITLDFRSVAAAGTAILRVTDCTFKNGAVADIRCFSNQTGGNIACIVTDCHFLGGSQGDAGGTYFPRYIDVADSVDLTVADNDFDFQQAPAAGKAGIVAYYNQAESSPTVPGSYVRAIITGNNFNRCGRDQTNGQGSIDLYGYSVDAVISGNIIRNLACRGIDVKSSDPRALIVNNQVDTAYSGLNYGVTGIVCNASTTADYFNDVVIDGNIINAMSYDGIYVNGLNTSGAGSKVGVRVTDNVVRGCGSGGTGRDIALQACTNAEISGNQCFTNGATAGQSVQFVGCSGFISFKGNQIVSPTYRCVTCNTSDNNSLAFFEIDDNLFYSPGYSGGGTGLYLGSVGGANIGDNNRFVNCATSAVFMDQSAVITASSSGTTLTISATTYGIVAVGQVLMCAAGATQPSIPGVYISAIGTYTAAAGTGTVTLSASPSSLSSATMHLTGNALPASLGVAPATPPTLLLQHNTVSGTVTVNSPMHYIDTYNSQSAGALYWINGGVPGRRVTFKLVSGSRVVTFKDNSATLANGNINIAADYVFGAGLAAAKASVTLVYTGVDWQMVSSN